MQGQMELRRERAGICVVQRDSGSDHPTMT